MITRKLGKLIRGNATPFQIYSASLLGILSAFAPGAGQAPGLYLFYLGLLILLNANLFLSGVCFLLAKLVYFLTLPILFKMGVFLLEGPLNGFVAKLVNAPILAWFGFEYYVTLPGVLIGLILGILVGAFIRRSVFGLRHKFETMEEGSAAYQKATANPFVKGLAWIFFGGLKGKKSWKELSEAKGGLPVRPIGIVLVVLVAVFLFVAVNFFQSQILTNYTRDALAKVNGATVDLGAVELDLSANRLSLNALALANPEDLKRNRFQTMSVNADLSGLSLLAKKIVIEELSFEGPVVNSERKLTGQLVGPRPEVDKPETGANEYSIFDLIEGAEPWKDRLATAKRLYDKVSPLMDSEEEGSEEPEQLSFRERLAQRAAEQGYANVSSPSVITDFPRVLIKKIVASELAVKGDNARKVRIEAENLSDNPSLLDEQGWINYSDPSQNLTAKISLPYASNPAYGVELKRSNLSVTELANSMKDPSKLPLKGGSMDIVGSGQILAGQISLPLEVTLRNTTITAFGQSVPVENLPLTATLSGSLESPKIELPKDALEQVVKEGGKKILEDTIKKKAGDQLGDKLKGLFGG